MAYSLRNRATSAPFRFPEETQQNQYHTRCFASHNSASSNHQRAKSAHSNTSPMQYDEFQKQSAQVQDEIWKSSCSKEKNQQVKWEKHWGFLAHYDQKGNLKEPKELNTDAKTLYSETVPNTSNGHYGQRSRSANTSYIQRLERSNHNLRKNKELLYYD